MVVHIDSHGEKCVVCVVYDMYTGYRQLDGTSELYSTVLCARCVDILSYILPGAQYYVNIDDRVV